MPRRSRRRGTQVCRDFRALQLPSWFPNPSSAATRSAGGGRSLPRSERSGRSPSKGPNRGTARTASARRARSAPVRSTTRRTRSWPIATPARPPMGPAGTCASSRTSSPPSGRCRRRSFCAVEGMVFLTDAGLGRSEVVIESRRPRRGPTQLDRRAIRGRLPRLSRPACWRSRTTATCIRRHVQERRRRGRRLARPHALADRRHAGGAGTGRGGTRGRPRIPRPHAAVRVLRPHRPRAGRRRPRGRRGPSTSWP